VRRIALTLCVIACGKTDAPPKQVVATTTAAPIVATSGASLCADTGKWAPCSVIYRLERAGAAPRLDSAAKPEEKRLSGQSFVLKIGQIASLDVFLYPDSNARIADGAKLDRKEFVNEVQTQTIRRERTLIENNNLIALLTSINERQRERVSDALMAGAPQPHTP
jgi:hypothetical protein